MSKTNRLKIFCLFIFLVAILSPLSALAETDEVQIKDGWNLIAFPVTPQTPYTAESLGQEINSQGGHCDRIMRWDGGSFETHLIGMPFGDFTISTQEGYFILSIGFSTWTVTGDPITTLSQKINEGWTLVNSPFEIFTAESMGNSITSGGPVCDRIMLWDGGSYQTHLIGMPFGDFPIKKGAGYFVLCDRYGTWDFSIIPVTKPTIDAFTSPTSNPVQTLSGTKDANTSIWMNGVEKVPIDSFTTWSVSIMLAEGQNNINVTAKNSTGGESQPVLASILLDTIPPAPPTVNYTTPTNGQIQTLSGTKETNASVWINGVEKVPVDDLTTWSTPVSLQEGDNSLTITSKDSVGNESTPATIVISLDTVGPNILVVSANPIKTNYKTTITGSVETAADLKEVRLEGPIQNSPVTIPNNEITGGIFTKVVTVNGTGSITATAYDSLDNAGAPQSVAVTLGTGETSITYFYDDLNRLNSMVYSDGTSIIFTYDEAGNITARTSEGRSP